MSTKEHRKNDLEQPEISQQAMAQLFRGELSRSDTWRTRLDTTTNWALTTTAAVISFGFASPESSHVTFLVGIWMVVSFLLIEARRYRYYDLWNRRVRLLEDGWWAPMLRREPVDPDALRELAVEMSRPQIQLSLVSAIATRLNRAYGPILIVLLVTWFFKVYSHPRPPRDFGDFVERAHVAWIPGPVVMAALLFLTVAAAYLFTASFFIRSPLGELRTRPRGRRAAMWEAFYRPYAIQRRKRPRPPGARANAPRPPAPFDH
ncbi:DUF2270 domain-containing protein [Corallococcus exiguus]|uniref:DUF2270 domain-containing protein n=2 Tax=Corallococcus exiguus TaxID=83462 RepID=A0A7Y1S671_9BACT|nr:MULTISPECIES: DUF2270 domain-containing protein [Corallococcus]NBC45927.1 DUF2270 domain-containing protein [Corallococcus exiguus]NNC18746.1 DUF2270 domain-containing protein [Corallococcus exiguus]NRD62012.1 DUF2270 domain-containing protein [Corallococcus exiguus]RKH22587.1 DUF2270 domain-containing protein [Corallococcus sp. CA041A]RKI07893.1 DUF2270 domain-containing protein [Corallococcus sp. AB030]